MFFSSEDLLSRAHCHQELRVAQSNVAECREMLTWVGHPYPWMALLWEALQGTSVGCLPERKHRLSPWTTKREISLFPGSTFVPLGVLWPMSCLGIRGWEYHGDRACLARNWPGFYPGYHIWSHKPLEGWSPSKKIGVNLPASVVPAFPPNLLQNNHCTGGWEPTLLYFYLEQDNQSA